jgi:hypothetical protein
MCRAARGLLWATLACFALAALLGVRLDWSPPEPDTDLPVTFPPLPSAPQPVPPEIQAARGPCPVLYIPPAQ